MDLDELAKHLSIKVSVLLLKKYISIILTNNFDDLNLKLCPLIY